MCIDWPIRSLMAQSSSSALASSRAAESTLPAPSFVGVALKTSRELVVTGNSWSASSACSGRMAQSVAEFAELVAIGLATCTPRARACRRANASAVATAAA